MATLGEEIQRRLFNYHSALIIFSSIAAVFLIISIRRAISAPIQELLVATERISKGELSYRIGMDRKDEFGTVANRFNAMVTALESSNVQITHKLRETELLLDVAKVAAATLDLKDALQYVVETISSKLEHDNCALYILNPQQNVFCLEASNVIDANGDSQCFSAENDIVVEMTSRLRPLVLSDDMQGTGKADFLMQGKTTLAVPVIRESKCVGCSACQKDSPLHVFFGRDGYVYHSVPCY